MKLAIIDLDMVVADNTKRFEKAEEAKQRALRLLSDDEATKGIALSKATDVYWRMAFTPELVALDTLIDGVVDALLQLERQGYTIYLLTSRPESMREATSQWLVSHKVAYSRDEQCHLIARALIMKAPAFQYTKTTVWKAGMVQTLTLLYGADEVLVVDDEDDNLDAITHSWGYRDFPLHLYNSLKEAIGTED